MGWTDPIMRPIWAGFVVVGLICCFVKWIYDKSKPETSFEARVMKVDRIKNCSFAHHGGNSNPPYSITFELLSNGKKKNL